MSATPVDSPAQTRASLLRLVPLITLLTLLWGVNWALFPLAVREVSVWTFRSICLLGSGALLLLLARSRGMSLHVPRSERKILVAAALAYMFVWHVASTYAAVLLPSGQAAVLAFTMPAWSAILSWLVLRQKLSSRLVRCVLLASGGIVLLIIPKVQTSSFEPLGFVLGLSAAIGWAAGTLILKRSPSSVSPIVGTGWQLVIAGLPVTLIAAILGDGRPFIPSMTSLAVISYITVVPTALGNWAWFTIVKQVPATVSGLSAVLVPVVAMLTGAVFFGEPLGWFELGAMVCCTGALATMLVRAAGADS